MKLRETSCDEFVAHISEDKADSFAKTFVAKANMQKQWEYCIGCWENDELLGAIITTLSKRAPYVFNLQLLHTFAKHRRKGVARLLTQDSLDRAQGYGLSYESMGFKFLGKQKSGTSLSMFRINGNNYFDGIYDINDPVINAAVYKKGKGGCVEVFL
jgi:GNAT superfamily N-acetyltransferase